MFLPRRLVVGEGFNPFLTPLPSHKNEVPNAQGKAVLHGLVGCGAAACPCAGLEAVRRRSML